MNKPKQIRNKKGKTVNCLSVVKFTPAAKVANKVVAVKKKPKPKGPRNFAEFRSTLMALIAEAERTTLNRRN